jgi:hypothetical protein
MEVVSAAAEVGVGQEAFDCCECCSQSATFYLPTTEGRIFAFHAVTHNNFFLSIKSNLQ